MSVIITKTCIPSSKAKYSAAVSAMSGIRSLSTGGFSVVLTKEMLADIDAARGPVLLREHAGRSEEQLKAWRAIVE